MAAQVRAALRVRVAALTAAGVVPTLAVVLVGTNPASITYVNAKERDCEAVGIRGLDHRLPARTSHEEVLDLVRTLNRDRSVHGILVQFPLPDHIDRNAVVAAIDPNKDVDGFHPVSMGRLLLGLPGFVPCTPRAVMSMLERSAVPLAGARVVVVGRSMIVGRPLAVLLSQKHESANATVTLCHSATTDVADHTACADVVIAAIGCPRFVTKAMVKPGAVVIDVGISRVADRSHPRGYRLVGDVDTDAVADVAARITPVPGGVGPMTRAMLLENTLQGAEGSAHA